MTSLKKKMTAGIVAGAILAVGGLGTLSVQAADNSDKQVQQRRHMERPAKMGQPPQMHMDAQKAASHIAEVFGVNQSEVKSAIDGGTDFRDIGQAAMLAKISGKSFQDVLSLKTDAKDWRAVGTSLGVTKEQVHATMQEMRAQRIGKQGNIDAQTALKLMQAGYQDWDIMAAASLAKASGKDIQSVLDMKKINNRWSDVAQELGVDKSVLRPGPGGFHGGFHAGQPHDGFMMDRGNPEDGQPAPEDFEF